MNDKISVAFTRLVKIMDELREQCPWDKKQTIQSLRSLTIEEMYELVDAIDQENWKGIKEELGDLLLHILFYSKIGDEQQAFKLDEMINGIADKLVHRHPHIYGNTVVENEEDVKRNWEKIKAAEGKKSVLEGVPNALPAIVKALRLQEKSKQVGFEWKQIADVWEKVEEEASELKEAVQVGNRDEIEAEFGDLLFSLVNYARFLQIDPEAALERTNRKFINRFQQVEQIAAASGKQLTDMSLMEMDAIWNQVKKMTK
ncbi:MAG: nucleoside triphosphate pyrophosphohydrolase [Bacteroidota bacterium]|jgi:MazG family protein